MSAETVHRESANGITYTLSIEPDDLEVRGNALASGDDLQDCEAEDEVIDRLNSGDTLAWASVAVTATLEVEADGTPLTYEGRDHLGACSYRNTTEFITNNPYWEDMKVSALDDLIRNAGRAVKAGHAAGSVLQGLIANLERTNKQAADDYARKYPTPTDPRQLIIDLWRFIENVTEDSPDRIEPFFALRERIREYLTIVGANRTLGDRA